jgi:uncharacterized protein
MEQSFQLDLVSEDNNSLPEGDTEITMDSPELDFYTGEEIFLEQYFEDQLILDLPLTVTCSDNCKGLCSICGGNLNQKQCDCLKETGNSPFSVLKDLKSNS